MMVKIINNDYTEESNNDIPLLYKLIKYMFKNKSNVDIEFMIYLHGYTNMDKIDQNNGMSLKDFILDIQDQYSNKDYDHDIDKIISFIKMIE